MAHAPHLRVKARELRVTRRLTIDEIAERLALSRSTIYSWVRDVEVGRNDLDPARMSAARERASKANAARYRRLRDAAYAEGEQTYPELVRRPGFRDFLVLYLAEGSKRS